MTAKRKATTVAELRAKREILATAPSGAVFKIRPLNLEQYALAGHLPSQLRQAALGGAEAVDATLAADDDALTKHGPEMAAMLDDLVLRMVVEPELTAEDLDALMPVDYRWLVRIAMQEEDRDGEGRRLWGREPLTVWSTFRHEHGCAEDCPNCARLTSAVADV
jgi:hypothetical protein